MKHTPSRESAEAVLFGLSAAELRPIVESLAGEAVERFEIEIRHRVPEVLYGYGGDKVIPTFSYVTRTGRQGAKTVFVKKRKEPGRRESFRYEFLARHGFPTAKMFGNIMTHEDKEILFLEYLAPVDDLDGFLENPSNFFEFLDLLARLNSICPSDDELAELGFPGGSPEEFARDCEKAARVGLPRTWSLGLSGDLGEGIKKLCVDHDDRFPRLQELVADLWKPIAQMPLGVEHTDLGDLARRRETGETLIVDLEAIGCARRFNDVSQFIGPDDSWRPRSLSRRELSKYYLERFAHHGGANVSMEEFLESTRLLWVKEAAVFLQWWHRERALGRCMNPMEKADEARADAARRLGACLSGLLNQVR